MYCSNAGFDDVAVWGSYKGLLAVLIPSSRLLVLVVQATHGFQGIGIVWIITQDSIYTGKDSEFIIN